MTPGQKGAVKRAIDRFEVAVDAYAFIGTIPVDSDDALEARHELEQEYVRSRECLVNLIERYAS